jgi:hypothetical protein
VQQTDEVAAAVADGAVERRVAGNSREKVDVSAVGQEAVAHVDAAELRDDVQGRVACERAVHDAAAARGGRKSGSKHADKIATLWRCVRNSGVALAKVTRCGGAAQHSTCSLHATTSGGSSPVWKVTSTPAFSRART